MLVRQKHNIADILRVKRDKVKLFFISCCKKKNSIKKETVVRIEISSKIESIKHELNQSTLLWQQ